MSKEVWFRRGDGLELSCEEGTPAFDQMTRDGYFSRITPIEEEAPAAEAAAEEAAPVAEETPIEEEAPAKKKRK